LNVALLREQSQRLDGTKRQEPATPYLFSHDPLRRFMSGVLPGTSFLVLRAVAVVLLVAARLRRSHPCAMPGWINALEDRVNDRAAKTASLPPSRAVYLQRRRDKTRAAILLAAREVFAQANYLDARVEDIFRRAGVSRATFYMHFASKLELAHAIYDEIAPQTVELFDRLPALASQGLEAIKDWMRAFIDMHVEHRYVTPLLAQLQLFESDFRQRILHDAEHLIDRLGDAGSGAFLRARGPDEAARRQRMRARLLMNRVAAVSAEIAREEMTGEQAELCLELVAQELLEFMRE